MDGCSLGLSEPQTLTLVEKVREYQNYYPASEAQGIYFKKLSLIDLSNLEISLLVKRASHNPAIRKDEDKDYVLFEGVLDKVAPELNGPVVVEVRYNFARRKPLIVVPGFYCFPNLKNGDLENDGIKVRILSEDQSRSFVEVAFLKTSSPDAINFQYTGDYEIWPGNPKLKTRKLKI